ncbi:hypothetical protein [Caldimonas brevitalea]|uniref:Integrase catalytic domain-containing protein n=1 Tax=Caldimonas brevitalea TaxID=413882 RepID=A0A0G3BJ81_9BURK|nr:hypothetical protein [Caldimonas brevitalea]AKJ29432.1 hypothetical protein AAW51_2741 [Caldimonas brevitalea]
MKRALVVPWGRLPTTRSAIPELLNDLTRWPTVDEDALPEAHRDNYRRREEAVRLFVQERDLPLQEIFQRTGVQRAQLYRMIARCLAVDSEGRLQGFRGLVPYKRLKAYERTAKVAPAAPRSRGGGAVGGFTGLLKRHPSLEAWLIQEARARHQALSGDAREVRKTVRRLHKQFLEQCRECGVREDEYPFNRALMGLRTLQEFVLRSKDRGSAGGAGTADARVPGAGASGSGFAEGQHEGPLAALPFDVIRFDAHGLDVRFTLRFTDSCGMDSVLELTRIFILVCLDVATRAVVGYHLALSNQYDSDDVAGAVRSCFGPRGRPLSAIAGLQVRDGAGFPSDLFDAARFPGWTWLQYDNTRATLPAATLDRLGDIVGCFVHAGPLGALDGGPDIAGRFFSSLARHRLRQVRGSTEDGASEPICPLADGSRDTAASRLMSVEELEQLVDVMLGDYNAEPQGVLGGRSPLKAMQDELEKPGLVIRQLGQTKRQQLIFLQEARYVTVRGKAAGAPRPHVNFQGVRYTSDMLANKPALVGQRIRVYFNTQDIRFLHAYCEDDSALGVLVASRSWRSTPHTLRQRQEILRLVRLGKLRFEEGEDALKAYRQATSGPPEPAEGPPRHGPSNLGKVKTEKPAAEGREVAPPE